MNNLHENQVGSSGERGRASSQATVNPRTLEELQSQVAEQDHLIQDLTAQLGEKCHALEDLSGKLTQITDSTAWAFVQILWRMRRWLAPPRSRRERWGRVGMRWLRRLHAVAKQSRRAAALVCLRKCFHYLPQPWRATVQHVLHRLTASFKARSASSVPLVSVILPIYNQASMLRDSVHSVLAQTYPNFELILLNDGSTDGIEAVLNEFLGHPRIRILTQSNQKLPHALSNGFEFARGEYWTWTSADNLMQPEQLAHMVAFLEEHPKAAMVYADYRVIDDTGGPLQDPSFRPHNRRSPDSPDIHLPRSTATLNTVQDNFIGPCFMYRGWVGRLIGEYDPHMCVEDYDYWMRINQLFGLAHLGTDEVLYHYRWHDNSLSGQMRGRKIYELTQQLMAYDQERRSFYALPWKIYADAATLVWLRKLDTSPHTVLEWTATTVIPHEADKSCLLLHANSLADLSCQPLSSKTCVTAWFDADATAPYRHHAQIQQQVHTCFGADQATVSRLALFTRSAFQAMPGAELLNRALAFSNNHQFYRSTRPASLRQRYLPQVYYLPEKPSRILFQVESLQSSHARVVLDLAAHLRGQHFDVLVLALRPTRSDRVTAQRFGIPMLTLPRFQRCQAYRRLLVSEQIDMISAHHAPWGAKLAASIRMPFVNVFHSAAAWASAKQLRCCRQALPHAKANVFLSLDAAQDGDLRVGLPPGKAIVLTEQCPTSALTLHAVDLFHWLIQGGDPIGAREWFRGRSEMLGSCRSQGEVRAA